MGAYRLPKRTIPPHDLGDGMKASIDTAIFARCFAGRFLVLAIDEPSSKAGYLGNIGLERALLASLLLGPFGDVLPCLWRGLKNPRHFLCYHRQLLSDYLVG